MAHAPRSARVIFLLVLVATSGHAQQPVQPLTGAPLAGLTPAELDRFERGKEAFTRILTLADGVGPISNEGPGYPASRCLGCHLGPLPGGGSTKTVRHFGVAATATSAFDPLHGFGGPVQQEVSNAYPACMEAIPAQATVVSDRITPSLFGLGLVDSIPDADIQVREAFPPPGVSGRANLATPAEAPLGPPRVGRFGWKSQVPTLLTFSGQAMLEEHGITNRLFPFDNVPNGPTGTSSSCADAMPDPEDVSDAQGFQMIDRVTDFVRFLSPPPRTPKSGMIGEALFESVGCAKCHVSTPFVTSPTAPDVALQNRSFRPYSDFLLHDIGTGDGIGDGLAVGAEIRTTPLWDVGPRAPNGLMHDASVRGAVVPNILHAAVMAHAGEATAVVAAYSSLSASEKRSLQRFLMSLGQGEFDYDAYSLDQRVTEIDWYLIQLDVTGPGTFFDAEDHRAIADFDQDGDIDLRDFAGLQRAFTGT